MTSAAEAALSHITGMWMAGGVKFVYIGSIVYLIITRAAVPSSMLSHFASHSQKLMDT